MKKRKSIVSAALALSLLTGCAGSYVPVRPEESGKPQSSPPVLEKVTANELVLRLLESEQARADGGSVILSPLSIEMALAMAANGAEGAAKDALETLLGLDAQQLNALLGGYLQKGDDTLSMANSMWFNETLDGLVDQGFKDRLAQVYGAGEGAFAPYSAEDAGTINAWVKEKTHDKIDSIVSPDALTDDTLAVLINALYFNGKWTDPFEDYQVSEGKFRAPGGDQDGELMRDYLGTYFESEGFTGFAKEYEDGYEFIGILPEEEGAVDLSKLDVDAFLDSERYDYDVDVKIPKFELEYAASLVETLKALGLESLFEAGSLNGMLTDTAKAAGAEAHVSDVVHKTYIKMYEEGTEAAAVTAVIAEYTAAAPVQREVKQVYLDRPFAFLIRDAQSGQVVFCGVINSIQP